MLEQSLVQPIGGLKTIFLVRIELSSVELEDFLAKYPGTTCSDLARICNCSLATTQHWFVEGHSRRKPKPEHKLRLSIADYVWSLDLLEPDEFDALRQLRREQLDRNSP